MPVKPLPPNPNLDHLKHEAKDMLKAHARRSREAAQRIREFHPRFTRSSDDDIFAASFRVADAQLTIARERGFSSWPRLKSRIEKPTVLDRLDLPHQERIADAAFRRAVDLLDTGNVEELRAHLRQHPDMVRRHVTFEGGNYFRNPTLLEFVAENPVRNGTLPGNIVEVAKVILEADAKGNRSTLNETLGLVSSGSVPRQCRVQIPLINLLCKYGADPGSAMLPALAHRELDAVEALIRNGAPVNLIVAAGLGRTEEFRRLLPESGAETRHRALALASQLGHAGIVRLLLDVGEDPSRYNPVGNHSHSTPLHQAAAGGHGEVVRLLVERGARVDAKDTLWQATPAGWAQHEGNIEIEEYLRAQEKATAKES